MIRVITIHFRIRVTWSEEREGGERQFHEGVKEPEGGEHSGAEQELRQTGYEE